MLLNITTTTYPCDNEVIFIIFCLRIMLLQANPSPIFILYNQLRRLRDLRNCQVG